MLEPADSSTNEAIEPLPIEGSPNAEPPAETSSVRVEPPSDENAPQEEPVASDPTPAEGEQLATSPEETITPPEVVTPPDVDLFDAGDGPRYEDPVVNGQPDEAATAEEPPRYEAPTPAPGREVTPVENETPATPEAPTFEETQPGDDSGEAGEADEAPPASPGVEELFDISRALRSLGEPGGWASDELRLWSDVSGQHNCQARLAEVAGDSIVLQRADGRMVQVEFGALSDADLGFVRLQVDARRTQIAAAEAGKMMASQGR